jgi:hypothetical protein
VLLREPGDVDTDTTTADREVVPAVIAVVHDGAYGTGLVIHGLVGPRSKNDSVHGFLIHVDTLPAISDD